MENARKAIAQATLKHYLREHAPDPVKRLRHSTIYSHAYTFKFSRNPPPPPPLFPLPHPLKWERKIIARKSITLETERRFTPQEKMEHPFRELI